jgi:hypothetical protein
LLGPDAQVHASGRDNPQQTGDRLKGDLLT